MSGGRWPNKQGTRGVWVPECRAPGAAVWLLMVHELRTNGGRPANEGRMKGLLRIFSMLLAVPVIGAAGFMIVVPGIKILDAFYLAVTTITTVGNNKIETLGPIGAFS